MRTVLAAAVQATPVFLDREATVEKVCRLAKEAAAFGAELIVLPEAFVPGYPDWVWRSQPWKARRASSVPAAINASRPRPSSAPSVRWSGGRDPSFCPRP